MKKLLLPMMLIVACATNDTPAPREGRGEGRRGDFGRRMMPASDFTLPASWWHDPVLVEPLSLSSDQFQKLDALSSEQDDIERLQRDTMVAMRDVQTAIDAKQLQSANVLAAGKRLGDMRSTLLDKQLGLLVAEREILTPDQWQKLQQQLAEERNDRFGEGMRGRGGRGMGGRGGMGGRRPGW